MTPAEFTTCRRLTGLTAQELADRWSVNLRTIRAYESGRYPVPDWAEDAIRELVAGNRMLAQTMADSGVIVYIGRDGWSKQAAATAMLLEPDIMLEWRGGEE